MRTQPVFVCSDLVTEPAIFCPTYFLNKIIDLRQFRPAAETCTESIIGFRPLLTVCCWALAASATTGIPGSHAYPLGYSLYDSDPLTGTCIAPVQSDAVTTIE
jgi:hypothetical protein